MKDIKIQNQTEKDKKKQEKRRIYMRDYYRRKKSGKILSKKEKKIPCFTITRGEFVVTFS